MSGSPSGLGATGIEVRHRTSPLVVGAGVAGLTAALHLGRATILTDAPPGTGGSSPLAQGGIAAAVGPGDLPAHHRDDTVAVADELAVDHLVEVVTERGPAAIAELIDRGARLDRATDGSLALGREAGHRRHRVVHANGDATGAEVMRALAAAVDGADGIEVAVGWTAVDLIRRGERIVGVLAIGPDGAPVALFAPAVVLATGGYGHAFARTSTPAQVRGDGIALAARARAAVADMEMVQFHPTALAVDADPLPLLTEALRGEGAALVDRHGRRFMADEHPDAELAPRDVVARAVYRRLMAGDEPALDGRAAVGGRFPSRFPTVFALAGRHGLDPRTDLLPATPAAHYTMGGVAVDDRGRTSLEGLWAIGEVSSSGLHGANRLASNSLLEALVMGRRAAEDIRGCVSDLASDHDGRVELPMRAGPGAATDRAGAGQTDNDRAAMAETRTILWTAAGVERDAAGLRDGLARLEAVAGQSGPSVRLGNAVVVARLVLEAALERTESRGAHHRVDHPLADPRQARRLIRVPTPAPVEGWAPPGDRRDLLVPVTDRRPAAVG